MAAVNYNDGSEIGFFNRVCWPKGKHQSESCHGLGRFCEWYFDVGQKSYNVVKRDPIDGSLPVELVKGKKATCGRVIAKVAAIFLKVLTYLTVVIPLIMFVAKCIYRSENSFVPIFIDRLGGPDDDVDDIRGAGSEARRRAAEERRRAQATERARLAKQSLQKFLVADGDVEADFSDAKIQTRIAEYAQEVHDLEIVTHDDLTLLSRIFTKLDSQKRNIEWFLKQQNRVHLEEEQRTYLQARKGDIEVQLDLLKDKANGALPLFKEIEGEFQVLLTSFDDENVNSVLRQIGAARELVERIRGELMQDAVDPDELRAVDDRLKEELEGFEERHYAILDKDLLDRYLTMANLFQRLTGTAGDQKVYDEFVFERAKQLINPTPLKNMGNTCYLNSALQFIQSIPEFVQLLRGNWMNQVDPMLDETEESFEKRRAAFEKARQLFIELTSMIERKNLNPAEHVKKVEEALKKLNDAFVESRCFVDILGQGGGRGQEADAIQPIELFLKNMGYVLETQRNIRWTPAPAEGDAAEQPVEERHHQFNVARTDSYITLQMKDFVGDPLYATSFQALLDHHFDYKPAHLDLRVEQEMVSEGLEAYKLAKIEDHLVVKLNRVGNERDPETGQARVIVREVVDPETEEVHEVRELPQGKHNEEIKFADGEILDFTSAFDPSLLRDGERVLYEVTAVARHHGGANGGAHWTADVKKGGQWLRCNDNARLQEGGMTNLSLGTGDIYLFKRVK